MLWYQVNCIALCGSLETQARQGVYVSYPQRAILQRDVAQFGQRRPCRHARFSCSEDARHGLFDDELSTGSACMPSHNHAQPVRIPVPSPGQGAGYTGSRDGGSYLWAPCALSLV
jgi:hypothetical protein